MHAELGVMVHTNRYEKGADMEVFEKIKQRIRIVATEACGYQGLTRVVSESELKDIIERTEVEYNNGWIPCSDIDRLPDDGTPVLVQDFEGYYEVCYCETKHGAKGFTSGDWWHSANNYIAWNKLPDPYQPKGENNENS